MSRKRFTDCDKWDDPWFAELDERMKLLWHYLCDRCDQAGVWVVNTRLASFHLGFPLDVSEAINVLGERIQIIDKGRKWYLTKFIKFQYPTGLCAKSAPHRQVIRLLRGHGIGVGGEINERVSETAGRVHSTPKDIDKDKDKDKEEDRSDLGTPVTTGSGQPKPAPTKPKLGILELRTIPGLKLLPKDHDKLIAVLNEVGFDHLKAAVRECIDSGSEAFESNVTPIAYRIYRDAQPKPEPEERTKAKRLLAMHGFKACLGASTVRGIQTEEKLLEILVMNPGAMDEIAAKLGAA